MSGGDVTLRYLLFGEDRSASKTVHGVGKEAESTASRIGGAFASVGGKIGGELGEVLDKVGSGLEGIGEKAHGAGPKLLAAGSGLTGIGAALSFVGSHDKEAAASLKAAVEATGGSVHDYAEEIEGSVKHMENFGHSAAETKGALATLTEATQDPKKALEQMGVVADLAAAKHVSLDDAATMVAKGLNGNAKLFRQYGIELKKNKDGTVDVDGAMAQLAQRLSGQASSSVDSFRGRIDVLKTKMGDWIADVGGTVGPILTALGPILMATGAATQFLAARQEAAAAAADMETGSTVAQTVVQKAGSIAARGLAAAQWLVNAAMTANPIVLVVVALAGLVAIFIIAWKHSETFRAIVTGAFHAVQAAASAVWGWIKKNWPYLLAILTGPIGLFVAFVYKHFDDIVGFIKGMPGKIAGAAAGMWNGIRDAFRGVLNDIISWWNGLHFHIPGFHHLGVNINGFDLGVPHIPLLDAGGIVTRPTLAMLAGNSMPEAIIPLSRVGGAGLGGTTNVFHVTGALDPDAVARKIDQLLRRLNSSTGGALGYA